MGRYFKLRDNPLLQCVMHNYAPFVEVVTAHYPTPSDLADALESSVSLTLQVRRHGLLHSLSLDPEIWIKINRPVGHMLGYPCCCINSFSVEHPGTKRSDSPSVLKKRIRFYYRGSEQIGFILCSDCAKKRSLTFQSLTDDINSRRFPHFPKFPSTPSSLQFDMAVFLMRSYSSWDEFFSSEVV